MENITTSESRVSNLWRNAVKIVAEKLKILIATAIAVNVFNSPAQAANAPTKITVQGRLTDPSGTPAPAGSKPFVFKIYDAATLGTEIWPNGAGESQNVHTDANGLWTAEVGSVISLTSSVFGASTRWLQITVNGEALSRIPINTTPYAYRVATLEGAGGGEIGDTLGVRDPGGNVAVYGANGVAYTSSGGETSGPEGISFMTDQPDTLGLMAPDGLTYWKSGSRYAEFGHNGVLFFGPTGDTSLTISDWTTPPGHARLNPAGLTYWRSGLRYAEFGRNGILFFSPTGDTSLTISDWTEPLGHAQFSPAGLIFKVNGDTSFVASTDSTTDDFKVGINTGHPIEALTVGGTARILPEALTPTDPWVSARRSMVIAQESADDWGRSASDSAGIYLPADVSDYSILSSKTSASQTILRMSVGDDPNDHILLMPSGNVGIGTTAPAEKLDISGNLRATRMALGNALINPNQALVAIENVATSDWGMRISNTGGGARVGVSSVSSNLAILDLESNGSDRWALGKGSGAENFFVSSDAVGTVLTIERSTGNVGIGSGTASHPLEMIASGAHCTAGGTWTNSSDSSLKANVTAINADDLLARIAQLPIQQWNYRAEDPSIRHIGPMAQDFHAAFGLGEDDKHITTIDADGVALAAIQALHEKQRTENAELRRQIAELREMIRAQANNQK